MRNVPVPPAPRNINALMAGVKVFSGARSFDNRKLKNAKVAQELMRDASNRCKGSAFRLDLRIA
jgi:hypothetical protein